ncbi:hypothetical protein HanHA300_Chr17g0661601 [Helianthus annuus]|nr:hypothetical protein HanHA300_Chr17g0661601 [Helianthus annuus]
MVVVVFNKIKITLQYYIKILEIARPPVLVSDLALSGEDERQHFRRSIVVRLEECFHISIVRVVSHRLALFRYEIASLRLSFLPQFNRLHLTHVLHFFHGGVLFELCRQLSRALGRCRLTLVSPLCSLWRGVFIHSGYGRVRLLITLLFVGRAMYPRLRQRLFLVF